MKTVRTATAEADRRLETRAGIQERCTVTIGTRRTTGTICDLSHGGAAIIVAGDGGAVGDSGSLALDRHGGAQARFDIRAVDAGGRMHVAFSARDAAFERALETLVPAAREARRA